MGSEVHMDIVDPQFTSILHDTPMDKSIRKEEYTQIRPVVNVIGQQLDTVSQYQFRMTDNKYCNLNKSYIEVAVQLQSGASPGTNYAAGSAIAMSYGTPWFYKCQISLGGVDVESTTPHHDRTMMVRSWLEPDGSVANLTTRNAYEPQNLFPDDPGQQQAVAMLNTITGNPSYTGGAYASPLNITSVAADGPNTQPNALYNGGFWRRQKLTDAGRVFYCRLPLSSIFGYACLDEITYSREIVMNFYPQQASRYIMHAANNGAATPVAIADGYLRIVDMTMFMYSALPSDSIQSQINAMIMNRTQRKISWLQYQTYYVQFSAQGSFTNTFTSISERPYWAIFTFIPQVWEGSQLFNSVASYQPGPLDNATNPYSSTTPSNISSAYLQYGSVQVPGVIYNGSLKSDLSRMYQTLLDVSGKRYASVDAPIVSFDDLFAASNANPGIANPPTNTLTPAGVLAGTAVPALGGIFMLAFDLRHVSMDPFKSQTPQTLILNLPLNTATDTPWSAYMTVCSEKSMICSGDGAYLSFTTQ